MPVQPPFYQPKLPGAGGGRGGLRVIPRTPSKGEDIANVLARTLMGIMQGQETKRTRGLEERKMGLEEMVGQAQVQKLGQPKEKTGADLLNRFKLGELQKMTPEQRMKFFLKPQVGITMGKPASPGERTKIAETRASIDALNNLKTLYDRLESDTGWFAGKTKPTLGVFDLTSKEWEDFMAATSAFRNAIIKEITGAQMSEIEADRILKQVPQEIDPPKRWLSKWEQSKKNLESLQKRRLEILKQSGLKAPGGVKEDPLGIR